MYVCVSQIYHYEPINFNWTVNQAVILTVNFNPAVNTIMLLPSVNCQLSYQLSNEFVMTIIR